MVTAFLTPTDPAIPPPYTESFHSCILCEQKLPPTTDNARTISSIFASVYQLFVKGTFNQSFWRAGGDTDGDSVPAARRPRHLPPHCADDFPFRIARETCKQLTMLAQNP